MICLFLFKLELCTILVVSGGTVWSQFFSARRAAFEFVTKVSQFWQAGCRNLPASGIEHVFDPLLNFRSILTFLEDTLMHKHMQEHKNDAIFKNVTQFGWTMMQIICYFNLRISYVRYKTALILADLKLWIRCSTRSKMTLFPLITGCSAFNPYCV